MSSTYLSLHYHLVFGTKERRPFMDPPWGARLNEYLGGTVKSMGGYPERIGGMADHVHLLVGLKATHCLSDFMRDLKKNSSLWVHREIGMPDFAWQDGYAAFTVSATAREGVKTYISRQGEHHRTKSFSEELGSLLEQAGIEFNPDYLE